MRCGRPQKTDAHQTENFAELVCSNSFRSDDFEHNAVGLLHEEMRRCGSLILRAADRAQAFAGWRRARRSTATGLPRLSRPRSQAHPNIRHRPRGDSRPACGRRQNVIVGDGPPHLARRWPRLIGHLDRRGLARLLRCHRAHYPRREHRPLDRLGAVALRQSRARRHRRRLPQLPDG